MAETKKAVLTKASMAKIKLIPGVSKECFLERVFRVKSGTGTCIYGAEIRDIPDDFKLPIRDTEKFIKMYDSLVRGNSMPELSYTKHEKEIGLGNKEVYEIVISNGKREIKFWSAPTPSMEKTSEPDKTRRFRPKDNNFSFKITSEELKDLMNSANLVGAKTARFEIVVDEKNVSFVQVRAFDKNIEEQANYSAVLDAPATVNGRFMEFDLSLVNVERLDKNCAYDVTMCDAGCLFESAENSLFFVFGSK